MNLSSAIGALSAKGKPPNSARVLNSWIAHAERQLNSHGGRVGWLIASTVVAAALQKAVDEHGEPLFLVKGGTLLQHRLPELSRATTDLDGLVRGDLDGFLQAVDKEFAQQWGPLQLRRERVEQIRVPHRTIKPRRFDVVVLLNGQTWRRVQVEVSPEEGSAGQFSEALPAPSLEAFGLPSPSSLVGLSMRYQIAQKVHASTDPHNPPTQVNDRARDVVDLILLRNLIDQTQSPSPAEVRLAIEDIFSARAREAAASGGPPRTWPARLVAHSHWQTSFARAAESAQLNVTMVEAITQVNLWLDRIDVAW